jgi:hypothetical protein
MAAAKSNLYADGSGVWREDSPGRRTGIAWDEVYRVGGYKLDGVTDVYTCVALDTEYGVFTELYHDWPGFRQVVAAITAELPGIDADWFQRIERLGTDDPAVEVWCRDGSGTEDTPGTR